jgi:hypothetical protein
MLSNFYTSGPQSLGEAQRRRWTFYEAVKVANRKKLLIVYELPRRDMAVDLGGARS